MAEPRVVALAPPIEARILWLRGEKVLLDADLAELYGVPTKRLNEQVRRNQERFPADFAFRLTRIEKEEVVANCDHLARLKFSPQLPWAFTEHGALMAANVLNSSAAIRVSLEIARIFVRLRRMLATHAGLGRKLDALERRYDAQFRSVFDALRALMAETAKSKRRIGF